MRIRPVTITAAAALAAALAAGCDSQGPATTKNFIQPGPPLPSAATTNSPLPIYNSPGTYSPGASSTSP